MQNFAVLECPECRNRVLFNAGEISHGSLIKEMASHITQFHAELPPSVTEPMMEQAIDGIEFIKEDESSIETRCWEIEGQ